MFIRNEDLRFLIHLENKLGEVESWSNDVVRLWELIERLERQRKRTNEQTRRIVAEHRKQDPNYARKKTKGGAEQ